MLLVTFLQRSRVAWALCALGLVACGQASDGEPVPADVAYLPSSLAECGDSLDVLIRQEDGALRDLGASYSEALAGWQFDAESCGLGAFAGACSDGKRLLYRNGGFSSEIRYFDGEQLVGVVSSGDVGFCPSVCPFSQFYGSVESVRCEAPELTELCPGSALGASGEVWMPFANGEPPGGCTD